MTAHPLHPAVAALLRSVAAEVVLPRFRALGDDDVRHKAPGDPVTVADVESEVALTDGLRALRAEARLVGEEAAAADPSLLDGLGAGVVWVVDPIDGTANFAAGRTPFALMVALAEDGVTTAGWILDPVTDRLCHAHLGHGAFIDGELVRSRPTGDDPPRAALATSYLPPRRRADLAARASGTLAPAPHPRCVGEQYPRLVLGATDVALFERALPWDHAPGALFVEEAGGRVARPDGSAYRIADRRPGLLAACSPQLWDRAAAILFG